MRFTWNNLPGACAKALTIMCMAAVWRSGAVCLAAGVDSSRFNGVNWADARDNFVDGWIIPSGIDPKSPVTDVSRQARTILTQLKQKLHINTVRLGINPPTVLDNTWWPKYGAIVREAATLDIKTILACWESRSSKDGKIDSRREFDQMWERVLGDFSGNAYIHFEIFNEPHGYSSEEWRNEAAAWMVRHGSRIAGRDRSRILVSGTGYSERLPDVAGDRRFDGCRLSFHLYTWFGGEHETISGWRRQIEKRIGPSNAARTIVTEWGAPMRNRPRNYYAGEAPDDERDRSYVMAMSGVIREWNMGSVYWPGLKDGDAYSLTERDGGTLILQITNESGMTQLLRSFDHGGVRGRPAGPVYNRPNAGGGR